MIGKTLTSSDFTNEEVTLIELKQPDVKLDSSIVYYRLVLNGVMYSSTSYRRQSITNDSVLYFCDGESKYIGSARKYLSVCKTDCTSCCSPCSNLIIADTFEIIPVDFIEDTISGASARQIHCINDQSR